MSEKEKNIDLYSLSNDLIPRVFKPVDPKEKETRVMFLLKALLSDPKKDAIKGVFNRYSDAYEAYERAFFLVLLNGSKDALIGLVHFLMLQLHIKEEDRYFDIIEESLPFYVVSVNTDKPVPTSDDRYVFLGYAIRDGSTYFAVNYDGKTYGSYKLNIEFKKSPTNPFLSGDNLTDDGKKVVDLIKKYTRKKVKWSVK